MMEANFEVQLHNSCVSHVLNNMAQLPSSANAKDYCIQNATDYFESFGWTVPQIIYPAFPQDFSQVDLHQFLADWATGQNVSQELMNYCNNLLTDIESSSTLSEFHDKSMTLIQSAEGELNSSDLQIFVNAVNVANSSLGFWFGQKNGVHTWTAGLIIPPPTPLNMAPINWWKVAGCDVVGALGGAYYSAGNPAVTGVSAAVASACSIIMQW